jgi:hypothetical protein
LPEGRASERPVPEKERGDPLFISVDADVIKDGLLTPCAKVVYAAICANVDPGTRCALIKISHIAWEAGCSMRTAQVSLKALADRGVIECETRYSGNAQIENFYRAVGNRAKCYADSELK